MFTDKPSQHVAYLCNRTNSPWKSQDKIRMILDTKYKIGAEGLSGNDDFGQMSAWYIFITLGFCPIGTGLCRVCVRQSSNRIRKGGTENSITFITISENQSDKNVYIRKVELNGKELKKPLIRHDDINKGGELKFWMSSK
ncbi:glycoside hydrolase domain-containing protein [Christiangramia sp.]|uniref:glycoside hydrolase domain-containing protein n=1 Tax=Christiangramia sp. TaxID=1931228 RepID=UPI00262BEAA1|nr:glycoside hydrolase domain-containing protein [Christiangramia sp.]